MGNVILFLKGLLDTAVLYFLVTLSVVLSLCLFSIELIMAGTTSSSSEYSSSLVVSPPPCER